jgi:hypothetical protein
MSEEPGANRQLTSVKCEIHGLRYNPNLHTGCARCRKEAGESIGQTGQIPIVANPAASGTYAAPAFSTPRTAVVPAMPRPKHTPTRSPGPTPRLRSTCAT